MNERSALWLYGSYARGDADSASDVDLFFVSDSEYEAENVRLTEASELLRKFQSAELAYLKTRIEHAANVSVSSYIWQEIEEMAAYGSLFLQHLKLEGQPLWEGGAVREKLREILGKLPQYSRVEKDLSAFHETVDDVRESLLTDGSVQFEMTVLATVLRHASILGCYLAGTPDFGRSSPIRRITEELGLDSKTFSSFARLCEYRAFVEGRLSGTITIDAAEPLKWCDETDTVISKIEERFQDATEYQTSG